MTREQLEQALHDARAEVEEARARAQERTDLLATMSHEIRTPMNGIIGMATLLLEEKLENEQRSLADVIHKSALALLKLINDTLDYSKLNAGRLEIEQLDFDLRVTVDEVSALLTPITNDKGLEFTCRVHHDVPSLLKGDPGRLRQVLFNLAGNAIKFTEKGSVHIDVERFVEDEERVTLAFKVQDTGIGMNEEQLSKLFEAYSQADATISRRFGGTGLGLSVSRQLVTLMGGEVGVESEPGKGSAFWFRVPYLKQTDIEETADQQEVSLAGRHILVADPSEALKPALLHVLRATEARIELAKSGAEAVAMLEQGQASQDPFSLVLVDMDLPDMNGTELGEQVRSIETLQATRLVLLTSVGRKGDAVRASRSGFSAYLTKPVSAEALFDALLESLRRKPPTGAVNDPPIITRHTVAEARRRVRLLVVEDDRVNQLVSEWTLKRQGFAVEIVPTGGEGVAACAERHYDLILMDMHLPDMDGFQALAQLKQGNGLDETPIIAMTADVGPGVREACLEAGFDDYVSKPVDLQLLSEKVRMWTGATTNVAERPAEPSEAATGPPIAPSAPAAAPPAPRKPSGSVAIVIQSADIPFAKPDAPAPPQNADRPLVEPDAHAETPQAVPEWIGQRAPDDQATPEPAPPGDPQPAVDLDRLEESSMGLPALRASLLKTFLAEVHPRVSRLAAAIAAGDAKLVEFEAHGLKGMAATIGADACAARFSDLEQLGTAGDLDQARSNLQSARDEVERAQAFIEALGEISDAA